MRLAKSHLVILLLGGISTSCLAEIGVLSFPGDNSWQDAQLPPLAINKFVPALDFDRFSDGIVPLDLFSIVEVPDIPENISEAELGEEDRQAIFSFSLHIAQQDVVALQQVALEDGEVIEEGEVLISKRGDLPASLEAIQLLRRAGVEEVRTLVNVAESFPKTEVETKFNKVVNLITQGIFEPELGRLNRREKELAEIFDGNPNSSFERYDTPGQNIQKKFILFVDLGRFYPIGLLRFHPKPGDGLRLSGYSLKLGLPGTESVIAGLNLDDPRNGTPGYPFFNKISGVLPTFVTIQRDPLNQQDTVAVLFDPPKKMQYFRLDTETSIDYDLAEIQAYSDGFLPEATYTSQALPLPSATLGRIRWEEEKIGDPAKSRAVVRFQTGFTDEPEVLFRRTDFDDVVEWRDTEATVIDWREDSQTFGEEVDLNDISLRLQAREIFNALSNEERFSVRIKRPEYQKLAGRFQDKIEPDLFSWSGSQPVENGGTLTAPGGRPFYQLRVDFTSDDASAATAIRNLRFEFDTPQAVAQVRGEIAPAINVLAGRDTAFVFALQAQLEPESPGFNLVKIRTPTSIPSIESVIVNFDNDESRHLERIPLEDTRLPGENEFKEAAIEDQFFVVRLPHIRPAADRESGTVTVQVKFIGRVIDFNTTFRASVFLDTLGARDRSEFTEAGMVILKDRDAGSDTLAFVLAQNVSAPGAGESIVDFAALGLEDRNTLTVVADITRQEKGQVGNLDLAPNPFTPNGDGINDQLRISYDVRRVLRASPVEVGVYDLAGRRVRVIGRYEFTTGGYTDTWDGKGDGGSMVPPGIYMLRIVADTDAEESVALKLVSVAY